MKIMTHKESTMLRLSKEQINNKKDFIHNYFLAKNAADGSKMDANSNVSHKTLPP